MTPQGAAAGAGSQQRAAPSVGGPTPANEAAEGSGSERDEHVRDAGQLQRVVMSERLAGLRSRQQELAVRPCALRLQRLLHRPQNDCMTNAASEVAMPCTTPGVPGPRLHLSWEHTASENNGLLRGALIT